MLTSTDACRLVDAVSRLTEARQGVRPAYSEGDALRALMEMARIPRGRLWLAKNLGIGEASARTLLKRLREEGLVTVDKVAGAELTDKGRKLVAPLLVSLHVEPCDPPATLRDWGRVVVVVARNLSRLLEIHGAVDIRDMAVSGGASAALVAVYEAERLRIPAVADAKLMEEIGGLVRRVKIRGDRLVLVLRCSMRDAYNIVYRLLEELCATGS